MNSFAVTSSILCDVRKVPDILTGVFNEKSPQLSSLFAWCVGFVRTMFVRLLLLFGTPNVGDADEFDVPTDADADASVRSDVFSVSSSSARIGRANASGERVHGERP